MERKYEVGCHVIYVDEYGKKHDALVTNWFYGQQTVEQYVSEKGEPGCNVLFLSSDEKKDDSYGRQSQHETSQVHKSFQPAHGSYWMWPDEV